MPDHGFGYESMLEKQVQCNTVSVCLHVVLSFAYTLLRADYKDATSSNQFKVLGLMPIHPPACAASVRDAGCWLPNA